MSIRIESAAMPCPRCQGTTLPDEHSSSIIAWYWCEGCQHCWSARLRNGRPDDPNIASLGMGRIARPAPFTSPDNTQVVTAQALDAAADAFAPPEAPTPADPRKP